MIKVGKNGACGDAYPKIRGAAQWATSEPWHGPALSASPHYETLQLARTIFSCSHFPRALCLKFRRSEFFLALFFWLLILSPLLWSPPKVHNAMSVSRLGICFQLPILHVFTFHCIAFTITYDNHIVSTSLRTPLKNLECFASGSRLQPTWLDVGTRSERVASIYWCPEPSTYWQAKSSKRLCDATFFYTTSQHYCSETDFAHISECCTAYRTYADRLTCWLVQHIQTPKHGWLEPPCQAKSLISEGCRDQTWISPCHLLRFRVIKYSLNQWHHGIVWNLCFK